MEGRARAERTELGARVHVQFTHSGTDRDGHEFDGFRLRRARIHAGVRLNDWIDGATQVDFTTDGQASARTAYIRFWFDDAFQLSVGQFKRPFDLFELTSSADILVIERDGFVPGLDGCAGVGASCSYSRFTRPLEFASLDVGVLATGALAAGRLDYALSLTNGDGANGRNTTAPLSWTGRLAWELAPGVVVGGNMALHDYLDVSGAEAYAPAAALDIEVGDFVEGFHLQGGVLTGRNWRAPVDASGSPPGFAAVQAIGAYRWALREHRAEALESVLRVSVADQGGAEEDAALLITPGLVLHLQDRTKVAANLDYVVQADGRTGYAFRAQTFLHF